MADVVDEHRAISGDKSTGLYFSFLTTTLKLGLALGVGLGFGIADLAGFDPETARIDDSEHWIMRAIIGLGELLFGFTIVNVIQVYKPEGIVQDPNDCGSLVSWPSAMNKSLTDCSAVSRDRMHLGK